MEKLQNKALWIISFKRTRSSVKCEILKFADIIKLSNFLFAHDSIKSNLPTSLCDHITLVNNKHSQSSRNQEANQVNIPTVRTKTIGSNSIKSKSVNILELSQTLSSRTAYSSKEKFLQIFKRLFYKGLCLTVSLLFIYSLLCVSWNE